MVTYVVADSSTSYSDSLELKITNVTPGARAAGATDNGSPGETAEGADLCWVAGAAGVHRAISHAKALQTVLENDLLLFPHRSSSMDASSAMNHNIFPHREKRSNFVEDRFEQTQN